MKRSGSTQRPPTYTCPVCGVLRYNHQSGSGCPWCDKGAEE